MIKQMTKYTFVLFHDSVEGFLSEIQDIGMVDIRRETKPVDEKSKALFEEINHWKTLQKKIAQIAKQADKKNLSEQAIHNQSIDLENILTYTNNLLEQNNELQKRRNQLTKELNILQPWGECNLDNIQRIKELGYTPHFYRIESKRYDSSISESCPTYIINQSDGYTYFVVLGKQGEKISLKQKETELPNFSYNKGTEQLNELENKIAENEKLLLETTAFLPQIENKIDSLYSKADKYLAGASSNKVAENYIDIFTAFSPQENDTEIVKFLESEKSGVYYIKEEAKLEDNPPIALKNNWFTRMFSVITDMYGRPAYNEFDPTPYIAVFFMLFFAMCMGDAGYGLLLVVVGFLLKRAKGAAKFAPLVTWLGVATFVIGLLLNTFMGVEITSISWVPDSLKRFMINGTIAGYDAKMVLALAIGVFHICVAMVVKAIYSTKNRGFANSLGVWGWTLLIVGGVIVGAIALSGVISKPIIKWIIIVLGIVSALGIFLLNDIHSNPLKNIGSGLWETYNTATGLLGDVLSYIRLYALGLAGGMLGQAFNDLGCRVLDGLNVPGLNILFFLVIVILGHVLNLAMSCLGAFVHPLRLNFLEFFKNSGYEGVGKTFNPLTNK